MQLGHRLGRLLPGRGHPIAQVEIGVLDPDQICLELVRAWFAATPT
jgi:hypothetical protein